MELWYTAGKTFAMLCVVLGVLLAFLYALKRLTQKGGIDHCQIRLISSFSIAPRKQIMVIDVMQERLVLGVTADQIICISKFPISATQEQHMPECQEINDHHIDSQDGQQSLTDQNGLSQFNNNPNIISQVQSEK